MVLGPILSAGTAPQKLIVNVESFTLPDGKTSQLSTPKPKRITFDEKTTMQDFRGQILQPSALKIGLRIGVVGRDLGSGQELPAREIVVMEASVVSPPLNLNTAAPPTAIGDLVDKAFKLYQDKNYFALPSVLNEALERAQAAHDDAGEAVALFGLSEMYRMLGAPDKAVEMEGRARAAITTERGRPGAGIVLGLVGLFNVRMGRPQVAQEYYKQSLAACRESGDKITEGMILCSLGENFQLLEQPQESLDHYNRALALQKELGDDLGQLLTLQALGDFYNSMGKSDRALGFLENALRLHESLKEPKANTLQDSVRRLLFSDKYRLLTLLHSLGTTYAKIGQYQRASEYLQRSLDAARDLGDKGYIAMAQGQLGNAYLCQGQPQKALESFEPALRLSREIGGKGIEASVMSLAGVAYYKIGQQPKALDNYRQALALFRETGDTGGEAYTLNEIAVIEENSGQLQDAERDYKAALDIIEGNREQLGGLSQIKVSYMESRLAYYYNYLNILLRLKKWNEAFACAEKTKARALIDLMSGGHVNIFGRATPGEIQQESALKNQTDELNRRIVALSVRADVDHANIQEAKNQLKQAETALQNFTDALLARYPDLAQKRAARTVTLDDVALALPEDAALIDYVTYRGAVWIFVVTRESGMPRVTAYRQAHNYDEIIEILDDFRDACANPQKNYRGKAHELYELLVAPVAHSLQNRKKLIICPDGPLWGVPFHALLDTQNKFLWDNYDISYAYSATAYCAALQRHDEEKSTAAKTLLALANPDFGGSGRFLQSTEGKARANPGTERPIIADGKRAIEIGAKDLSRAIEIGAKEIVRGDGAISPLPGTQTEIDAIQTDFPDAVIKTGKQALESVVKADGAQFRYLHFATHGIFNDAAPLLSSIVLAQPPPGSKEDGFLTAREIFNLKLNADMVVLSACDTGKGQSHSGEGVVGLTWALFVAGVPSQVVSQWKVNDAGTALFMKGFYAGLKDGQSKSAALRRAALALKGDVKYSHPYYWAPFTLIGNWR